MTNLNFRCHIRTSGILLPCRRWGGGMLYLQENKLNGTTLSAQRVPSACGGGCVWCCSPVLFFLALRAAFCIVNNSTGTDTHAVKTRSYEDIPTTYLLIRKNRRSCGRSGFNSFFCCFFSHFSGLVWGQLGPNLFRSYLGRGTCVRDKKIPAT